MCNRLTSFYRCQYVIQIGEYFLRPINLLRVRCVQSNLSHKPDKFESDILEYLLTCASRVIKCIN